jgi:hypothetical protein
MINNHSNFRFGMQSPMPDPIAMEMIAQASRGIIRSHELPYADNHVALKGVICQRRSFHSFPFQP